MLFCHNLLDVGILLIFFSRALLFLHSALLMTFEDGRCGIRIAEVGVMWWIEGVEICRGRKEVGQDYFGRGHLLGIDCQEIAVRLTELDPSEVSSAL